MVYTNKSIFYTDNENFFMYLPCMIYTGRKSGSENSYLYIKSKIKKVKTSICVHITETFYTWIFPLKTHHLISVVQMIFNELQEVSSTSVDMRIIW